MARRGRTQHIHPELLPAERWEHVRKQYGFTPREATTLRLLCRGFSNEEMLGRLGIERTTLRTYLRSIYGKLRCRDRVDVILTLMHKHKK